MTAEAKRIFDEALALPEHERLALVEALSDSLEPSAVQLAPQWKVRTRPDPS